MTDPVKWWNDHRESAGMDAASKRGLLALMRQERHAIEDIGADLSGDWAAEWHDLNAARMHELMRAIAEIEAAQ